jgi:hypothetical protein
LPDSPGSDPRFDGNLGSGILRSFGNRRDLGGELQRQHHERLMAIGAHNQKIGAVEPGIQLAESITATFDFDAAVNTEQWHRYVAAEPAARRAGERHPFCGKASVLQQAHDRALGSIAFLP